MNINLPANTLNNDSFSTPLVSAKKANESFESKNLNKSNDPMRTTPHLKCFSSPSSGECEAVVLEGKHVKRAKSILGGLENGFEGRRNKISYGDDESFEKIIKLSADRLRTGKYVKEEVLSEKAKEKLEFNSFPVEEMKKDFAPRMKERRRKYKRNSMMSKEDKENSNKQLNHIMEKETKNANTSKHKHMHIKSSAYNLKTYLLLKKQRTVLTASKKHNKKITGKLVLYCSITIVTLLDIQIDRSLPVHSNKSPANRKTHIIQS